MKINSRFKLNKLTSAAILFLMAVFLLLPSQTFAALINASGLIGQVDINGNPIYTTSAANNGSGHGFPNAIGLDDPTSVALDPVDHRLFVADRSNNRVVAFRLDSHNHIASHTAIFVLGASDFTTQGSGATTQSTFGGVDLNLTYDSVNKRLFVSDWSKNRILCFNVPPNAGSEINGENATFVLGQSDFFSSTQHTSQNGFWHPVNPLYDKANNRLFVADQLNNREMIFHIPSDATSSINGENADYELGQRDFNTSSYSDPPAQNTMHEPACAGYDPINNRLFVTDYDNDRVLVFPVPLNTNLNGENANYVIGQPDFVTNDWLPITVNSRQHMNPPDEILGYDPATYRLFVEDGDYYYRIMEFVVPPGQDITYRAADNMLGQEGWTDHVSGVSQNKFIYPSGSNTFDPINNILFVEDGQSNRILEFDMIHIANSSFVDGAVGSAYSQAVAIEAQQGTSQSFSLANGSLPDGLSINSSTGIILGTPTVAGSFTFTIQADDNFSTGPFFDQKTYSITIDPAVVTNKKLTVLPQTGVNLLTAQLQLIFAPWSPAASK
jgi:hypothetical protein